MVECQSTMVLDVVASSRASSLPQGSRVTTKFVYGKNPVWERACSRWWSVSQRWCWMWWPHREQARSHRGSGLYTDFVHGRNPNVGASLLAMAECQSTMMLDVVASSRASSLPQGSRVTTKFVYGKNPVWERACSRWWSVSQRWCWMWWPHREQARSHRGSGLYTDFVHGRNSNVGAGLLAKVECQSVEMLDVMASSRASPLPQGIWVVHGFCARQKSKCGSELARDGSISGNQNLRSENSPPTDSTAPPAAPARYKPAMSIANSPRLAGSGC
ncbi:hypothetical protein FQZ97_57240 [compost metagenome]